MKKIFIPIKEKSQRVNNKNFRSFGMTSLWEHTVQKLAGFNVYIDTDSEFLIDKANKYDYVTCYDRKEYLRGHDVAVNDLIRLFIEDYCDEKDLICQIHVTTPFLKTDTINTAFEILSSGHLSVASCNILQSRLWREDKWGMCPINHNPMELKQTQDLEVLYEENSAFYAFNARSFLDFNNRVSPDVKFVHVPFPESLDIDTESEFDLARKILANK